MKKLLLWSSAFGLAVVVGIGVAVVTFEPASAFTCDVFLCYTISPHATISSVPCTCPNGSHGYEVTRWCGYTQNGLHCGAYSTFCSACPPYGDKGPWPYYEPGE